MATARAPATATDDALFISLGNCRDLADDSQDDLMTRDAREAYGVGESPHSTASCGTQLVRVVLIPALESGNGSGMIPTRFPCAAV